MTLSEPPGPRTTWHSVTEMPFRPSPPLPRILTRTSPLMLRSPSGEACRCKYWQSEELLEYCGFCSRRAIGNASAGDMSAACTSSTAPIAAMTSALTSTQCIGSLAPAAAAACMPGSALGTGLGTRRSSVASGGSAPPSCAAAEPGLASEKVSEKSRPPPPPPPPPAAGGPPPPAESSIRWARRMCPANAEYEARVSCVFAPAGSG